MSSSEVEWYEGRMQMPSSATISGKTGPDRQVTTLALNNVTNVELDLDHQIGRIKSERGITEIDLRITTVITDTITQGNHVIVIS